MDSWLPVLREVRLRNQETSISVISSQPWVYARLSPRDDLALQLESLDVGFEFWLSEKFKMTFKRFRQARRFALCLNFCRGAETRLGWTIPLWTLLKLCKLLNWGLQEQEMLACTASDVVLSDIYIFSSALESRDLDFLDLTRGANFLSLFHGTFQLEESNPLLHHKLLSGFRSVTAFATGPAQVRSYAKDYGDVCRIREIRPPRYESHSRKVDVASNPDLTLLFLLRNPREFKNFSTLQAVLSLIDIIRSATSTSKLTVALKAHPNQPKVQMNLIFTAVKLWSYFTGNRVYRTLSLHKHLENSNVIAASWFSGVLLDFVSRGRLAFEVRAGSGIHGPNPPEHDHWDAMWRAGLIERATSKEELLALVTRQPKSPAPEVTKRVTQYFFETPSSTSLAALEVLRLLGSPESDAFA